MAIDHHLALLDMVADEQVANDGQDLFAPQLVKTVPPALELEKSLLLPLRLSEHLVVLLPHAFWPQGFEVLDQPRAVETSVAQVGREVLRPNAAQRTARQSHRVDVGFTGPVRQRGTVQDRKAGFAIAVRQCQRDRPAALAVSVHDRSTAAMTLCHDVDEACQRFDDRSHRLAFDGLRVEDDEVDRMAFEQRHADFGVASEATDARAVPGARVDHDHGCRATTDMALQPVRSAPGDPQQPVVAGWGEVVRIGHRLCIEVQQGRHAGGLVVEHVVGALAQQVHGCE